ncbi:hypothetical protein ACFFRR_006187 [Megaselia abdita]
MNQMKSFLCFVLVLGLAFKGVMGSCLEYGHSCWGAHGKRSGVKTLYPPKANDGLSVEEQTPPPSETVNKYFLLNFLIDKEKLSKLFNEKENSGEKTNKRYVKNRALRRKPVELDSSDFDKDEEFQRELRQIFSDPDYE